MTKTWSTYLQVFLPPTFIYRTCNGKRLLLFKGSNAVLSSSLGFMELILAGFFLRTECCPVFSTIPLILQRHVKCTFSRKFIFQVVICIFERDYHTLNMIFFGFNIDCRSRKVGMMFDSYGGAPFFRSASCVDMQTCCWSCTLNEAYCITLTGYGLLSNQKCDCERGECAWRRTVIKACAASFLGCNILVV